MILREQAQCQIDDADEWTRHRETECEQELREKTGETQVASARSTVGKTRIGIDNQLSWEAIWHQMSALLGLSLLQTQDISAQD